MHALSLGVLFAALVPALGAAQTIQVSKDNRTIAITTSGDAEAVADQAVVTVGFSAYGETQDATYADASRISNSVSDALHHSGIQPEQMQSVSQSLSGLDENDKSRFSQGLRFIFSQSWHVTVSAASAAETLHVAITAGANESGNIDWQLRHDDALEAEAAQKALSHAREIADRMAKGLNAHLGQLIYASNQTPRTPFAGLMVNADSASAVASKINLKPLAISPQKISRSATVYAVFGIE